MKGTIIRRNHDDHMVPLCVPKTQVEAAIICSLLQSESIPFFESNEFFGSLKVGPMIPHYNKKAILVPQSSLQKARDLIREPIADDLEVEESGLTFFEKLRMTIEVFFFGWVMPRSASFRMKRSSDRDR